MSSRPQSIRKLKDNKKDLDELAAKVARHATVGFNDLRPISLAFNVMRIPEASDEHIPSESNKLSVSLAIRAFEVLSTICKDPSTDPPFEREQWLLYLSHLWPPQWKWALFLHKSCLHAAVSAYGPTLCARAFPMLPSVIIMLMSQGQSMIDLVKGSPGIIEWAVDLWQMPEMVTRTYIFYPADLVMTLVDREPDEVRPAIAAVVTAAGGPKSTASCLMSHMNNALSDAEKLRNASADNIVNVLNTHVFILDLMARMEYPQLLFALLCEGMMKATVRVLKLLTSVPPAERSSDLLFKCHRCLRKIFEEAANSPFWLCQALDAGLLVVIVRSEPHAQNAILRPDRDACKNVRDSVESSFIYRSVLRCLARALDEAERVTTEDERRAVEGWEFFRAHARQYIHHKEHFDNSEYPQSSLSDCERPGCPAVHGQAEVKRCAGCLAVFYCSKSCQTMGWPVHKRTCKQGKEMLAQGLHVPISKNDRAFIAFMVKRTISAEWASVVDLLVKHQGKRLCLVAYCHFVPIYFNVRLADEDIEQEGGAAEWEELKRAARESRQMPWRAWLPRTAHSASYVRGLTPIYPHPALRPAVIESVI